MLNMLVTRINIEMTGDTRRYLVSAKQGDKATRYVIAKLLNEGCAYMIPSGARVAMNVKKPDGKHVYNTCTYSGSEVTIELTSQTLAAAGTACCDIEVRTGDDAQIITSASFTIEIERSMRSDDAIISSNEFTELEDRIKGHIENLDDTEKWAREAEVQRQEGERSRIDAENERNDAEDIRKQNEISRIEQEGTREIQESDRQKNTNKAVKDAEDATKEAADATRDCIAIIQRAETALENEEQLGQTLEEAREIRKDVSEMKTGVEEAKRQIEEEFSDHTRDTTKHITEEERTKWNGKAESSPMTAASASTAGAEGLVPAPGKGTQDDYLTGSGTWQNADDHAATFNSGDMEDPTGWADIVPIESGEKHSSLWRKVSLAVKNLRYLKKLLGTTDISAIGGGTITGAINALNTGIANLSGKTSTFLVWYGVTVGIYRYGRMGSIASISGTLSTDLRAYTKYTLGTIAASFRPLNQLTKIILIQGDVQAMLNITREGVVELTPYAVLAKGYVPLISEMYEIS